MNILVLNCGSSSIKYQLLKLGEEVQLLAKGLVDRIGIDNSELEHKVPGEEELVIKQDIKSHTCGIELVLKTLTDNQWGVIRELGELDAVGHRVAHGGEFFSESVQIDAKVKQSIHDCIELAPLHNPANLAGIEAMEKLLPEIPQVAVFDTAFHQSMPREAYLYSIPYDYYEKYSIRRYGFHGTSHKYVAQKACGILGKSFEKLKIITCHLGNGASIAAINKGQSVDTSMGFTPNEGLMMGTRSGSVDPGIISFLAAKENISVDDVNILLNKNSGVKGVSKHSSDMRDLAEAAQNGKEQARLALQMYAHRVRKYIGAYVAVLNGLDLLIMTGGIGENNDYVRDLCLSDMDYLGICFDKEKNSALRGKDEIISTKASPVTVMTITTNEELVIAQETFRIAQNMKAVSRI